MDNNISSVMNIDGMKTRICKKFKFPTKFVAMLIGKKHQNVKYIGTKTNVYIHVETGNAEETVLSISGIEDNIERARLEILRMFPPQQFPGVDMQNPMPEPKVRKVEIEGKTFVKLQTGMELVRVTSVISPNHIFIHRHMQPMFKLLEDVHNAIQREYFNKLMDTLPKPFEINTLCIVKYGDRFYRGLIIAFNNDGTDVLFVDFGGVRTFRDREIFIIKYEFTIFPFQAIECHVKGISPVEGNEQYSEESITFMKEQVRGKQLFVRLVGKDEAGIPLVKLYDKDEEGLKDIAMRAADSNLVTYQQ